MFISKKKRISAFALSIFAAVGILGSTIVSAHPFINNQQAPQSYAQETPLPPTESNPPSHPRHRIDGHMDLNNHWVQGKWVR